MPSLNDLRARGLGAIADLYPVATDDAGDDWWNGGYLDPDLSLSEPQNWTWPVRPDGRPMAVIKTVDGRTFTLAQRAEWEALLAAALARASLDRPGSNTSERELIPSERKHRFCVLAASYVGPNTKLIEACKRAASEVPDDYALFHPTELGTTGVRRAAYEAVRQFRSRRAPRA